MPGQSPLIVAGCMIHVELVRIVYPTPVETASESIPPVKLCDVGVEHESHGFYT